MKSSYDDSMHLYTTKLEVKDTPEWHQRERTAERIAADIERNSVSRNNQELENGDELDEEMRHSAVIRPGSSHAHRQNSISPSHNGPRKLVLSPYVVLSIFQYISDKTFFASFSS